MQDVDTVANGIRTISLRILGTDQAKKELQEIGGEIDDYVGQTISKKRSTIKEFTSTEKNKEGVDILDEQGNYRKVYDILLDISKVYKDIQEQDKKSGTNKAQALLETLGGKTRANVVASIISNGDILEAVKSSSEDSEGSAQAELEKYLDSIEGRMTQLKTDIEEFWSVALKSDVVKGFVSLLDKCLQTITGIVEKTGALPAILGVIFPMLLKNVDTLG